MAWIKALHIISVVCWFAGIFYLPRLFVYHAMAEDPIIRDYLKIMERKLYRFMSIFAVTTIVFGLWLASYNWSFYWQAKWFILKLMLVVALITYHLSCGYFVRQLARNISNQTHVFFRWFNELPVVFLFAIVIMVVVKPFS